jgi:membrane protein YdbS with pleckstrin-like domain
MPDIFIAKDKQPGDEFPPKDDTIGGVSDWRKGHLRVVDRIIREESHGRRPQPLSSFAIAPRVHFETQEKKETIILLLRRHMITNLHWILKAILMMFAPTLLSLAVSIEGIPPNFLLLGAIVWYLLCFAYVFEQFLSWVYNVNIITDERVIVIKFPSLLYRELSETKIDKIQEVDSVTGGFFRTLFNFGNIVVQTAGEIPEVRFEAVPNPGRVSVVLNDLILEEEREKIEGRVS